MWTDIQTNKLTDGRTDDPANRHTDKWTDRKKQTDGRLYAQNGQKGRIF